MNYQKKFSPYITECKTCDVRITVKSKFNGGYCLKCADKEKYKKRILKNQVKLKSGYWICQTCIRPRILTHKFCYNCGASSENCIRYNDLGQVIDNNTK